MVQSLRVFAVVAVMVFASIGCQKGTRSAAKEEAEPSAASTDSKAGETESNAGETQAKAKESADTHTADASTGSSQAKVKGSTLTEADNEAEVDLRVGDVLTVVVDANHDSGLSWTMAKPTDTVIVPEGKPVYAAKPGKAAADPSTGTETWRFRAAKRGQQTVRLEYLRGMQQSAAERTFRFTATVR
jgi:predicted secreted protein